MEKLRFALMGCGRIAQRHAEILSNQIHGAILAAVCDVNQEKAKLFLEKYDIPYYNKQQ